MVTGRGATRGMHVGARGEGYGESWGEANKIKARVIESRAVDLFKTHYSLLAPPHAEQSNVI